MIRLRTILQSNYFYIIILILASFYTCFYLNINRTSKYLETDTKFSGIITKLNYSEDKISLTIKGLEKLDGIYYLKDKSNIKLELGMKVELVGSLIKPTNNTVPNTFNYRQYLYNNNKFYSLSINTIKIVSNNTNIFYSIKNFILNKIDKIPLSKSYIKAFVLGDNNLIDDDALNSYNANGVSHLLAISGTHISLISVILLGVLKKLKLNEFKRYIITDLFLLLYMFLTAFAPSVMRASIFFIMLSFNKVFHLDIKTIKILLLTLAIILFINPLIIYSIGFLYSFTISFYLLCFNKLLANKNYLKSLIIVGIISFLSSFPITIYNFYQVNILSIIYNLLFVPFVSFIVFPLSLITLLIPFLDKILYMVITFMENTSLFLDSINIGKIILMKPNLLVIGLYYVIITYILISFKNHKYLKLIYFLLIVVIHYNFNYIKNNDYLMMIDVGQGDSLLLSVDNKNILIDTGGKIFGTSKIAENTLLPFLKSKGIRKLDYLILTHGDMDHLGEANKIIDNFKVDEVVFNNNSYNNNELKIINNLKKKNIKFSNDLINITYNNMTITALNNNFKEENDASIILLVKYKDIKMLLMGDASIKSEKYILNEYNLDKVHILKVGHHGSKTSTSEEFLKLVNPEISLISVGLKNTYKHPSEIVVDRLNKIETKKYFTSINGSVVIDLNNTNNITSFPSER